MSLVRHSSHRGLKRTWTPNPSLAVMPGTPARTTRSGLNFRSIGGAAYGPKGYMAGAALDFAANKIKRAYTNYRAKSGKMFASHIPRSMRTLRFRTPVFNRIKGNSSSRKVSIKKPSNGDKITRKDLRVMKDFIMPSIHNNEYVASLSQSWNTGRQDVWSPIMFTNVKMDEMYYKGKDLLSPAFAGNSVFITRPNDSYDRQMILQLVSASMRAHFVNMCNHDLTIVKYTFKCIKAHNKSPEELWNEDLLMSQTSGTDVVDPTVINTSTRWGASPKRKENYLLNKYYKLVAEKVITLEIGAQHCDVTRQPSGFYKGTQWRNPQNLAVAEDYASTNSNCTFWPGMIMPMYIGKSKDFVVATLGTVTTPGSGKYFVNTSFSYTARVPPPSVAHSQYQNPFVTGLVDEVNYNPETEAKTTYTTAGV